MSKLVVQAVDDIYDNSTNSTWRRTFIRNISPLYLRLANWPFNHIDYARYGGPSSDDWPLLIGKWFITSIAISFVVRSSLTLDSVSISLPYDVTDTFQVGTPFGAPTYRRDSGSYDPIPYISVGYPKVCRNLPENEASQNQMLNGTNPISERILRPRYLCFLSNPGEPAIIMNVEEYVCLHSKLNPMLSTHRWSAQHKSESNLSYIMVAYTAEQFTTNDDLYALHKIADTAARNAGVHAYWIGCSCMPEKQSLEDDVCPSFHRDIRPHDVLTRTRYIVYVTLFAAHIPLQLRSHVPTIRMPSTRPISCCSNSDDAFGRFQRFC